VTDDRRFTAPDPDERRQRAARAGIADYKAYAFSPELELAVGVARATGRPLLLRGTPGCGKSTLARDVALSLRLRFYQEVVTSRTTARDLLWRFDAVRRLGDATHDPDRAAVPAHYVEPRALWWAFDPVTAIARGANAKEVSKHGIAAAKDPGWGAATKTAGAVVLIDEIDKADPDVPNDLLIPLGENMFRVEETGAEIDRTRELFVVITTNDERELPPAFLRRCVVAVLDRPDVERMLQIAKEHHPDVNEELVRAVEREAARFSVESDRVPGARKPGTAEVLDTLQACKTFGITTSDHPLWSQITRLGLWKYDQSKGTA
jgi:MoxR-like ATPase